MLYTNYSHTSSLDAYLHKDVLIMGTVHREYIREGYSSYDIVIHSINGDGLKEKIRTNIYDGSSISPGTEIILRGQLYKPMANTNPMLFNHRQYLLTKNIKHLLRTEEVLPQNNARPIEFGYEIQNSFKDRLDMVFDNGLSKENAGFMKALLTGGKDSLQQEEYELYREMGIAHILAISGLHIGILTGFLLFIMSRTGVKRNVAIPAVMIFIWLFTYLVGFPESALRASVMLSFVLISKILHRAYDPINLLAVSYIICLLINPFWIFSLGFQLSYGATLSLATIAPWIQERIYPAKGKLAMSVGAVMAVNAGILPLQSYYFNQLPLMALFSNILIVPVATANLILGSIIIAIPALAPILNWLLNLQRYMIDLLSFLPIEALGVASPSLHQIILYVFFLIVVLKWRYISYFNIRIMKVIVAYLLLISAMGLLHVFESTNTEIHFIDVGQGDSALVRVEGRDYLIDTGGAIFGSYDPGEAITLPYLKKLGVRKLDGVFISHFHEDHYKGLFPIMEDLEIEALYVNNVIPDADLEHAVKKFNIPVFIVKEGSRFDFGGSYIECIYSSGNSYTDENNNSLVLLLRSKGKSTLFTGDIEVEVERLLTGYDVDILKVAHHGSRTSSSVDHISRLLPEVSVISAGRNNSFGHPHDSVLETLEKFGSSIYRTDEAGLIKVVLRDDEMEVLPYNGPMYQMNPLDLISKHGYRLSWIVVYCILSYISTITYTKMEEKNYEIH
jgi:competence protein ComEC